MRQITLDTETTGLSTKNGDRIIEIGCVEIINRNITGKIFHSYCNPEKSVGQQTISITGITDQFLVDKPKFGTIVDDLLEFIGDSEIIIHNANFDLEFINNELNLLSHNITDLSKVVKIIDSLELARKIHPGQRNNLDALSKRYNINVERKLHGALLDATILAKLFLKMTAGQISLDFAQVGNMLGHDKHVNPDICYSPTSFVENDERVVANKYKPKIKVIYANSIEQQLDLEYMSSLLK